jgi:hypothetical protein
MEEGVKVGKPFAWSYSRLKNFEACPLRHYEIDIAKNIKEEEESENLTWGNAVHKALARRLSLGTPLPESMVAYEKWCERIGDGSGRILVEQKLAISGDFGPTGYFDGNVWYRSIADVIKIMGPVALAVDWKTGKVLEDGVQLALMAACIFAHYPAVKKLRTEFIWLKEDCTTREDFNRDQMAVMWRNIWHRIEELEAAHKTQNYPAKPGRLCRKWCPVTTCKHHGT